LKLKFTAMKTGHRR